jgi:phosphoglycolate phosphatase
MIKAVIIDFDDTLCLTEQACFELENETLRLMGRPPQPRDIHRGTWGQPLYEAITVRSPGVDVRVFRQIFEEQIPTWVQDGKLDAINPKNFDALDVLANQGKELYILTSRTHKEAEHLLAADHDLANRIKAFYYRDIMEYHKPDPRAFDILLNNHGLERSECVYVGDSPSDAAAAKQGHMHFIASLESGVRTREDFAAFEVDVFIDLFTDLPQAITTIDK